MQKQNYMITAEEVAESMGISLGYAYKLLRKLNKGRKNQLCCNERPFPTWQKLYYDRTIYRIVFSQP